MSDASRVEFLRIVFACITCGQLLSVDNHEEMGCTCPNCGAAYDLNGDINLARYGVGRHPSQWHRNGWDGESKAKS